ncbi:hypothetical protein [Metabacillus sediminilitoris]|uniref:Uncharacterized protein n=1 Tax=Metabacillus sediminilitoris TaxID=2567941 RepID=A0A4S4C5C3_9BACI|nr:hypothetical protein [Metabacillus sediminilitoris]THF82409.1 hypothetical protein E6W99_02975 [Metabacillus sediminilitoris]
MSSRSCNEPEPGSKSEEVINEPILHRLNTDKPRMLGFLRAIIPHFASLNDSKFQAGFTAR